MSKIIGLKVSNVKRLKAVTLRPEAGKLVIVRGKNAQGKSSLLNAIRYAFAGKSSHPPRVIREGESEAEVVVETEDFTVIRRWRKGTHFEGAEGDEITTEIELRGKDGAKMKSPQAVLDKVVGDLTFDPMRFARMKPAEQLDVLKQIVGVDTGGYERARAQFYEKRTTVNRDLAAAEAKFKLMPTTKPAPRVDVAALQEMGKNGRAQVAKLEDAKRGRDSMKRTIVDREEAVKVAAAALEQARKRLDDSQAQYAEADNLVDELSELSTDVAGVLEALEVRIRSAVEINTANERWEERSRQEVEVKALAESSKSLTAQIDDVDKKKADAIAAVKFPVDGLGLGVDGVSFKGLPFEQASSAEQLRVSVAIGAKRNPKFRALLVEEGSFLDVDQLGELERYCVDQDVQCFVEMVGEEGPASVVIRDGEAL